MNAKLTHEEIVTLTEDTFAKISDWFESLPDLTGVADSNHNIIDHHTIPEFKYSNCHYSVNFVIQNEFPSIEIKYEPSVLSNDARTVEIHINEEGCSYDDPFVSIFQALSITTACWNTITQKIIDIISSEKIAVEEQINKLPSCIASLVKFTE